LDVTSFLVVQGHPQLRQREHTPLTYREFVALRKESGVRIQVPEVKTGEEDRRNSGVRIQD